MPPQKFIKNLLPRLFEDDLFLAVEKPAGLDVGAQADQTGVIEILSSVRTEKQPLFVVHRLSRHESGVLLLGKTAEAAEFVRNGLKGGRVDQEYVAVVIGRMKDRRLPIGPPSKGGVPKKTKALAASRRGDRSQGIKLKAAGRLGPAVDRGGLTTLIQLEQSERRTLVRCLTTVPNTHALRAQLRSVRLRLVGDNVHDPSPKRQLNEATCLHLSKLTFYHPKLKTRVGVTSPIPDFAAALEGGFDVERVLRAALARRLPILVGKQTDSFRLVTGPMEGLRGINAEIYGDVVILYVLDEKADDKNLQTRIGRWYMKELDAASIYVKPFVKNRLDAEESIADRLRSAKPLLGTPAPEQIEIRERNLKYLIRPYDGYSVGLFLDHRENRARVYESAGGAEVLNLFAYTCGFSVAAAAGGAKSTTSVDVSAKNLEWGKANFGLNHVDPANHSFVRSDSVEFLRRAKKQEKSFDLIVIDPPSFAHGRGSKQDFSIVRDLPDLVAAAVAVLRKGGGMMVSTNFRKMSLRELKELVRKGSTGHRFQVIAAPPLPIDFAIDRDHAKTIFCRFDRENVAERDELKDSS